MKLLFTTLIIFYTIIANAQELQSLKPIEFIWFELVLLFFVFAFFYKYYKTKEKLQKNMQELVRVLDESCIVSKTDLNGKITYVNDLFCKVSGYTKEELIGKNHNLLLHPEMGKDFFENLWKTINNKKIFKGLITNKAKDGHAYYVDTTIVPILDTNNMIVEFIASRYEVTELVEQKNKAIQAEIIKDNFLAHMSHELRTPLNAMIGFNSLALSKTKEPVTKKMLETSLKSSNILLEIINKILDLVKIKNNQCQLKTIPFHLRSNLESIAMMYEHECNEKHILFESYLDPSCTRVVEGDWIRISQIINNLLSNALKFTPKNKSVSFQCYFEKNIFVATISDTGIGISKEFQKEIFNEFSQVDTSTTKQFGGMGLGLSISSALAKMMGATLTCESDLGVGSSFTFKVPLETVKENSPDEKKSLFDDPSFTPLKGKVLVAEDNRTNQMLISILLEEMGLECTIVDNGSDAVEAYLRVGGAYDLILLDQDMPVMDGITAMEQIRKRATKVAPIIALTSNNMTGDKEKFLEAGMDDFISKPVDEFELYNIIKKHLLQDA